MLRAAPKRSRSSGRSGSPRPTLDISRPPIPPTAPPSTGSSGRRSVPSFCRRWRLSTPSFTAPVAVADGDVPTRNGQAGCWWVPQPWSWLHLRPQGSPEGRSPRAYSVRWREPPWALGSSIWGWDSGWTIPLRIGQYPPPMLSLPQSSAAGCRDAKRSPGKPHAGRLRGPAYGGERPNRAAIQRNERTQRGDGRSTPESVPCHTDGYVGRLGIPSLSSSARPRNRPCRRHPVPGQGLRPHSHRGSGRALCWLVLVPLLL